MHLYTSTNPILIQGSEKERGLEGEQTYLQIPICNLEDPSRRYGGNNFPHKIILLKGNYSCFDDNKSRKFLLLFLYYTFLYFFFLDFFFFFVIGSPVSSLFILTIQSPIFFNEPSSSFFCFFVIGSPVSSLLLSP